MHHPGRGFSDQGIFRPGKGLIMMDLLRLNWFLVVILAFLGLYCLLVSRNLLRLLIGIEILSKACEQSRDPRKHWRYLSGHTESYLTPKFTYQDEI